MGSHFPGAAEHRARQLHSEIVECIIRSLTEHARSVARDEQRRIAAVAVRAQEPRRAQLASF
jgi:hypothetical protein